jgi:alpha-ribazole phosphatase/probable phosphoglycerate mutase
VTTTIDLMRHGEPVGGSRYRGRLDDPLSDRGWAQMHAAVGDHRPWEHIVSSPLLRCRAFAEALSQRLGLPLEIDPRWQELDFGDWEGHSAEELWVTDPQRLRKFWSDPITHPPPGGESLAAFGDRVMGAWNELLTRHAGRHLLVVGHAGVIRMVVRHVLDMPLERLFRIQVPNAGITRVQVTHDASGGFPTLLFHAGRL